MRLLEDVYANYRSTIERRENVGSSPKGSYELAINEGIPAFLVTLLTGVGRNSSDYRVYGGLGQLNLHYAKIPWVAICDKAVTTSTKRGHFIVLLFKEDMTGCYLSLNQGYSQYTDRFGTNTIAKRRIERTAVDLARFLGVSQPLISGKIDLASSGSMGRGYALGAIASQHYPRDLSNLADVMRKDLAILLDLHDRVSARVGGDILNYLPGQTEDEYQDAASALAKSKKDLDLPEGPQDPPSKGVGKSGGGYKRDPKIAAKAIRNSGYQCEAGKSHVSFVARNTGRTFVEAHHLIPMGQQADFRHSIDVTANVVALCPNCHRMLHCGVKNEKAPVLKRLLDDRTPGLAKAGLKVDFGTLQKYYGHSLTDDD